MCSRHFRDPFERMHFPLAVGAVCTAWRSIALHTSTLWSTIALNHIVTRCSAKEGHGNQREEFGLIERFLRNSRHSQLSIYIQLTTSNRDKTLNVCCQSMLASRSESRSSVFDLASLLAPHASRFQRFHVLSTRYSPVRELLSVFPQVVMPCLEELHIDRVQSTCSRLHYDCPRTCLESLAFLNIDRLVNYDAEEYFHDNFPVLKSIALSSVPLLLPVFTPRHLTSLKMTLPHLNFTGELRNLLMANSHSLENLSFMTTHSLNPFQTRDAARPVPSRQLVVFPLVTKLSISFVDPDTLVPLMSFLRFPSAKTLRIADAQRVQPHSSQHLFQSLFNCLSFGHLDELDLENIFNSSGGDSTSAPSAPLHHPYNILGRVPAIRLLALTNIDQHVLSYLNSPRALMAQDGDRETPQLFIPLSRLTHLYLAPGDAFDIGGLVRFFRERQTRARDFPILHELKVSGSSSWVKDLTAVDMRQLALRSLLLLPSPRARTAGIWDEDIADQSVIDLTLAT